MSEIGEKLRSARIERGYTIDDLQKKTKIQKRYLAAIEEGKFDQLPGDFYVRAFVKQYADSVGLDSTALLEEYSNEIPRVQPEEVPVTPPKPKKETLWNSIRNHLPQIGILAAAIIIVCLVGFVMVRAHQQNSQQIPRTTQVKQAPAKTDKAKKKAQTKAKSQTSSKKKNAAAVQKKLSLKADSTQSDKFIAHNWQSVNNHVLKLNATTANAWITISTNNQSQALWQGVINSQSSQSIDLPNDINEVQIKTGNAPATQVYINDEQLPVSEHQTGTVHTYTLTIKE